MCTNRRERRLLCDTNRIMITPFNQLFDIKENLKSKENDDKQSQLQQATGGNQVNSNHNNGNHNISLDLDEKVTLFKYKSLKILELVNQNNANGSFSTWDI